MAGAPNTRIVSIKVHTPKGPHQIDVAKVLGIEILPIPVVAERTVEGKIRRWIGFPLEILDEEMRIVPPSLE